MHACRDPLHCILPPYVLDRLVESPDPKLRRLAVQAIARSATLRATRTVLASVQAMAAIPSPAGKKTRLVYDLQRQGTSHLPGKLVRSEGEGKHKDRSVNEAYDFAGVTYDFFRKVYDRNSLDNHGMTLISTVHVGRSYNNAFWNGEQMAYGDGDGSIFGRFTKSIDVVGHELSHGVVSYTSNLEYHDEPGALNEHFADVFGSLVRQWRKKQTAKQADWMIGSEIMGPEVTSKCLRTLKGEPAYADDPILGSDPQPKYLKDQFTGTDDSGGVHINSGIPNHAFHLLALELGGYAWEKAGRIWYQAVQDLNPASDFAQMVEKTELAAIGLYTNGSTEHQAVLAAWKAVGF